MAMRWICPVDWGEVRFESLFATKRDMYERFLWHREA